MAQNKEATTQDKVFDPLAEELAKVPKERQGLVRRYAAVFVAGMEAMERIAQTTRTGA